MLNITVAGTTLSTYYLSDPGLFLHAERAHIGTADRDEGVPAARRALRRLIAAVDDTTTGLAETRKPVAAFLAAFGWTLLDATAVQTAPEVKPAGVGAGADGEPRVWVVLAPGSQPVDAAPTGRRAGRLRPQRQAEVCLREGKKLPTALVCNGQVLRVVRRDPGLGGEASYLEIDLPGLAELSDDHEWAVLWALLRPEAFTPGEGGTSLWDRLERASADAAEKVSEDLSEGVRIAISEIANGALADLRRRDIDPPEARDLFADALKIAYRILFAAYAEDRGLLSTDPPTYRDGYSLRRLRELVRDPATVWAPDGGYLWAALRAHWRLLRDGRSAGDLQITGFNGGLFDPDNCRILDYPDLTVGDGHLARMLDALSYTRPRKGRGGTIGRRQVNYRELGVEQLGSVYEGLLSFEPQIADAPKVLARVGRGAKQVIQVVGADDAPPGAEILERYPTGTFLLFAADGQRKGSGSFYTPRKLAHYVVREALEPLVSNATPEEILALRVCDPAMGSGAFLVPAVHFLTEAYGEALARAGQAVDDKLDEAGRASYRRKIVERCIYGVDANPMAVELAKVSLWLVTAASDKPLSFLDARLRCGDTLVGASLESWDGVPKPLARAKREEREGQIDLFDIAAPDLRNVIDERLRLATDPSDNRLQVVGKVQRFARILDDQNWNRLRQLADWWVAPFFFQDRYRDAAGRLAGNAESLWRNQREFINLGTKVPEEVDRVRREINPFHWELEFPEVFFAASGERRPDTGFDLFLGNPPWEAVMFRAREFYTRFDPTYAFLRSKTEKEHREAELGQLLNVKKALHEDSERLAGIKSFIKSSGLYQMLYWHGTGFNLYRSFLERELALLASGGRIGLTIDAGVVGDAATAEHRRFLLHSCTVDRFVLVDNVAGIFPVTGQVPI